MIVPLILGEIQSVPLSKDWWQFIRERIQKQRAIWNIKLNDEAVQERTEATIKFANVSSQAADTASEQLTAIWNNFADGTKTLEYYVDVITALGATTASSSEEIATGLEKFAAIGESVGLSYEYATSALATVTAATRQSADTVGTAFKTLFARIQDLKLGETLEDDVTLDTYSEALASVGVSILDANNNLKDMDDILEELGAKWNEISSAQQVALAQTVAGTRQYTQLMALMNNWSEFQTNLATAYSSEGTLDEQQQIYSEGWEAARDRVTAALENIYDSLINEDFYIGLDKVLTKILDFVAGMIDGFGGLDGVITSFGSIFMTIFSDKIAAGLRDFVTSMGLATGKIQQSLMDMQKDFATAARDMTVDTDELGIEGKRVELLQDEVSLRQQVYEVSTKLNPEQSQQLQNLVKQYEIIQQIYSKSLDQLETQKALTNEAKINLQTSQDNAVNFKGVDQKKLATMFGLTSNSSHTGNTSSLTSALESFANSDKGFETITAKLEELNSKTVGIERLNSAFKKSEEEVGNLSQEMVELAASYGITTTDSGKFKEALEKLSTSTNEDYIAVQQFLTAVGYSPEAITNYIAALNKLNDATLTEAQQAQILKEAYEKLSAGMEKAAKKIDTSISASVTRTVSLVMAFNSLINAINSIIDLTEEWDDLSTSEKISKILGIITSVAMVLPSIIKSIKEANIVITETSVATTGLGATIAAFVPYIAIIVGIGVAIYELYDAFHDSRTEAEKLSEQLEELEENLNTCQEAAEDLKDTISSYDEAVSALDDLTSGTEEYAEQLKEANEYAKDLIETYGLWDDYTVKNGIITFNEGVLDNLQTKLDNATDKAQEAVYQTKIAQANNTLDSIYKDLPKTINLKYKVENDATAEISSLSETLQNKLLDVFSEITADSSLTNEAIITELDKEFASFDFSDLDVDGLKSILEEVNDVTSVIRYYVEQIATTEAENVYGDQFAEIAGDNTELYNALNSAMGVLLANDVEEDLSNVYQVGDNTKDVYSAFKAVGITEDNYISDIQESDIMNAGKEAFREVALQYATQVLGYSAAEANNLNIEATGKKATISDTEGNILYTSSFGTLLQELVNELTKENAFEQATENNQAGADFFTGLFSGNTNTDIATAIVNAVSSGSMQNLDLTDFLGNINLEEYLGLKDGEGWESILDIEGFEDGLGNIGSSWKEFQKSFQSALGDTESYLDTYAQASATRASEIKDIVSDLSAGEELTSTQLAYVDSLIEKYPELQSAIEAGGATYISYLRQIQEYEEGEQLNALTEKFNLQSEKATELKNEIAELQQSTLSKSNWGKFLDFEAQDSRNETIQLDISAKTEEFDKTMADLLDTKYELSVAIDAKMDSDIDEAFDIAQQYQTIADTIGNSLTISIDKAQEIIAAGYGEILNNAEAAANGQITMNQEVYDSFIAEKEAEIEADKQSKLAQLQSEETLLEYQIQYDENALESLTKAAQSESTIAKAQYLEQATNYVNDAENYAASQTDILTSQNTSNEEISTQATNLLNSLGITHKTDAENAQTAYGEVSTAAVDAANNQIAALSAVQTAVVKLSSQIANMWDGELTKIDLGSASLTTNIGVGSSVSTDNENTYESSDTETITSNANDILAAASAEGNTSEILDEAISQATSVVQADLDQRKATLGANKAAQAALNSASASNLKTSSSGSGSSSSSTKATKEKADLQEIEDRYHEIEDLIEAQEDATEKLGTSIDRTFGTSRLDLYKKKQESLTKEAEYQKKLAEEAAKWLVKDVKTLSDLGLEAKLDENNRITNYSDLLQKATDAKNEVLTGYNEFIEKYNNMTADEQSNAKQLLSDWEAKKKEAETLYSNQIDALEQLDETGDKIREAAQAEVEALQEAMDTRLEEISYQLEIAVTIRNVKKTANDFSEAIAEAFSRDVIDKYLNSDWEEAFTGNLSDAEGLYNDYVQIMTELANLVNNVDENLDTTELEQQLADLQDQAKSTGEELLSYLSDIENQMSDALDAAAARIEKFTNQLSHNKTILESIEELYALQGVTYKTIEGYQALMKVSETKYETDMAEATTYKQMMDGLEPLLEEAAAKLAAASPEDANYNILQSNYEAYLDKYNSYQESMYSSTKSALEDLQSLYTTSVNRALAAFEDAVTNGLGFDLLQDKYDNYIDSEEEYLDSVNEAYEVASWYNKLQADIDNADNKAYTEKLKALQEEINLRREGNTLSEYDLEVLDAKYKVLQAQMALEDAQNNKSELRLVRDSQGNWNYQYTADSDTIAEAQQELLDAENELYNLAKDKVTETTSDMIQLWQDYQKKLQEIANDTTTTEEEKNALLEEAEKAYNEKYLYLESERNVAVQDMTDAANQNLISSAVTTAGTTLSTATETIEKIFSAVEDGGGDIKDLLTADSEDIQTIVEDSEGLIDSFENTYAEDLTKMTASGNAFKEASNTIIENIKTAWSSYQSKVEETEQKTGTDMASMSTNTDKIATSTENLKTAASDAATELINELTSLQLINDQYSNMATSISTIVGGLKEIVTYAPQAVDQLNGLNSSDEEESTSLSSSTDIDALVQYGLKNGYLDISKDSSTIAELALMRKQKIEDEGIEVDDPDASGSWANFTGGFEKWIKMANGTLDYDLKGNTFTEETWKQLMHDLGITGYATGGYTGDFDDGKLAILHEKELVLNQDDTKNILSAVSAVRTLGPELTNAIDNLLEGNIQTALASLVAKLTSSNSTGSTNADILEQHITIETVEFPNVTSSAEIEEAFANIANNAAQYIRRRTS